MKLYLSSYRIPNVDALAELVDKQVSDVRIVLLPNAKDYYASRAKNYKINDIIQYQTSTGLQPATVVDLTEYRDAAKLRSVLSSFDVIWAVGGNTFCLLEEMLKSGFADIIHELLAEGIVYGGDSAGAVAVGTSLRGIESVDIPDFAENPIYDGLGLIDNVILPHADNDFFTEANQATRDVHNKKEIIELNDNQALIVNGDTSYVISS